MIQCPECSHPLIIHSEPYGLGGNVEIHHCPSCGYGVRIMPPQSETIDPCAPDAPGRNVTSYASGLADRPTPGARESDALAEELFILGLGGVL